QEFRLATAVVEHIGGEIAQPLVEAGIDRPYLAVGFPHLVECYCHILPGGHFGPRAPFNTVNVASFTPKARDLWQGRTIAVPELDASRNAEGTPLIDQYLGKSMNLEISGRHDHLRAGF